MIKGYGIAHVTLTVSNIQKTKAFYKELFQKEFSMDDKSSFSLLDVGIPCWFVQWEEKNQNDRFNEKRIGLDHVAFRIETIDELNYFVKKLDTMNVHNSGLKRFAGKYPYVAFRDPDNIQTEFFIPKEI